MLELIFNKVYAFLPNKLKELLNILQNAYFSEKVRFPEVTHYFCFMRTKQTDN